MGGDKKEEKKESKDSHGGIFGFMGGDKKEEKKESKDSHGGIFGFMGGDKKEEKVGGKEVWNRQPIPTVKLLLRPTFPVSLRLPSGAQYRAYSYNYWGYTKQENGGLFGMFGHKEDTHKQAHGWFSGMKQDVKNDAKKEWWDVFPERNETSKKKAKRELMKAAVSYQYHKAEPCPNPTANGLLFCSRPCAET
jgi:hypothetical protein